MLLILPACRTPPPAYEHDRVTVGRIPDWIHGGGGSPDTVTQVAVAPGRPFTELVASVNATPRFKWTHSSVAVEARVRQRGGEWSPWLLLCRWGGDFGPDEGRFETEFAGGRVAVDELLLESPADEAQVRVLGHSFDLGRLDITTTRRAEGGRLAPAPGSRIENAVPFIANAAEDPDLRSRLCSPTSLNMVLNAMGADTTHADVIEAVYDERHDLYGVWPRNIQAAWTFGVPGYLARFSDWREVRTHLETAGPLVISITAKPGEVRNMPYESDGGHLIVLAGLTESGDAIVIDPALRDEHDARRIYHARDLSLVWLSRKRGTAYALLPPAGG
jgi:hypothetical protein